jgi:copper chaperone NosL
MIRLFAMKKFNYVLLLAALLPVSLYFYPMWVIDMGAPQFPEGLQMRIFIDKITGDDEHSLQSINGLNHYIGMKKIEPESISELKYMPGINLFMIITGIILAFYNRNKWFIAWLALFSILGAIGLYDFYVWQTDFATNLDPKAILKSADISYQPPLIGTKTILNFVITSLPGLGGYLLFAGLTGGWIKVAYDYFLSRKMTNEKSI